MSEVQKELERLLKAEREACERAERLNAAGSTMTDKQVQDAAQRVCDEATEAVRRFLEQHPEHRPGATNRLGWGTR
jgi:hypothetical protein